MRGKFEAPRGKPSGRHLRRKRTSVRWKPLVLVLTLAISKTEEALNRTKKSQS